MSARYDRYIGNYDIAKKAGFISKVAELIDTIKKLRQHAKILNMLMTFISEKNQKLWFITEARAY